MNYTNWLTNLRAAINAPPTLQSVFTRVDIGQEKGRMDRSVLLPKHLVADQSLIQNKAEAQLSALLDADLKKIEHLGAIEDPVTMFYLMQKYGWRVSPTESAPVGVSWFDDFKIQEATKEADRFILLKGDLTGIQGYIYGNIQQKTAGGLTKLAKRLRGRSAIVSLLTDFLANIFISELGLGPCNLLFAGGGHFNLLIPDTADKQEKLKVLQDQIDNEMQRLFGDQLQLVIAQVTCGKEDIISDASSYFDKLNSERDKAKLRPHATQLKRHFYPDNKAVYSDEVRENREKDMEIFGERFPNSKYLLETKSKTAIKRTKDLSKIFSFKSVDGDFYTLFAAKKLTDLESLSFAPSNILLSAQVLSINSTDFLQDKLEIANTPISFGFRFIGKYVPMEKSENRPKNFEEICKSDDLEMLAAMRLDVDDLSAIFSRGLGKSAPLAAIAALSREMQLFFSAYFDDLSRRNNIYVIYSGGDDAFVVGQWKEVIQFAQELHSAFTQFVCQNGNLHFSAGIFMGKPHYPVGRFYRDAGNLLDEAKNNQFKNRVDVFNHALTWDSFESKIRFGTDIASLMEKGEGTDKQKLTVSFTFRLLQMVKSSFYERDSYSKDDGKFHRRASVNMSLFARNSANLRYLFARNGYAKKDIEDISQRVESELVNGFLRDFNVSQKYDKIKNARDYLVALNYALFTIRSNKKTNTNN